jgi:hypothetical protein
MVVDGLPAIFPVSYAVKDDGIYFLSAPGSKLAAAAADAVMAFEVDHEDPFEHGGWSVVVVGPSSIVTGSEVEPLWRLKLGRWVGGGPEAQVRIQAEQVSGREIGRPGVRGWLPETIRRQQHPSARTAGEWRGNSRRSLRAVPQ